MKKIIIPVALLVVAVIAYFVFSRWPNNTEPQTNETPQAEEQENMSPGGQDESVSGIVIDINVEQVAADGPALVTINTSTGARVIAVPSFGLPLCAAAENILDVYTLAIGDSVSVRGETNVQGQIVPCEQEAHYLRSQ